MARVSPSGSAIGGVGRGNVDAAILDLFVDEKLLDLCRGKAVVTMRTRVTLSPVEFLRICIGIQGGRKAFRPATCSSCMTSHGAVGVRSSVVVDVEAVGKRGRGHKAE